MEEICGMETALFQFCKFIAPVQGFNFQGQYIETNCNNLISESFSFPISIQPWSFMLRQKSPSVSTMQGEPLW